MEEGQRACVRNAGCSLQGPGDGVELAAPEPLEEASPPKPLLPELPGLGLFVMRTLGDKHVF